MEVGSRQSPGGRSAPAPWRVVARSVAGSAHKKHGKPCQDAHAWSVVGGQSLLAAVADGAGSAAWGGIGAAVAAASAVRSLEAQIQNGTLPADEATWKDLLGEALQAAIEGIAERAEEEGGEPRDLATTLLICVATPAACAVLQVGDGCVVAAARGGNDLKFTLPARGGYVNETTFVTSEGALESAQLHVWSEPIEGLAMLTDGLQRLALDMAAGRPFAGFFAPLFAFAARSEDKADPGEDLERFLRSERVWSRTDDDVTLLLAALKGRYGMLPR
ncbi:MAG: protein phosphatase 2C domain-containing protein [Planctomycetes bacterium]|nr:protein phosphatase 2C domain-containing protein [Planctomycetota bacterium]